MKICYFQNKKHTDTFVEQTKTKSHENLEFRLAQQLDIFSFNPPINFFEERKLYLAVRSFEATKSVFNIIDENNSFSLSTLDHCSSREGDDLINRLQKRLEMSHQNDIELQ